MRSSYLNFFQMKKKLLYVLFVFVCLAHAQECPNISYPLNGAIDIPVDATITWPAVNGINGYLISLGTTPGGSDIVNRQATGIDNFYKAPVGLPENSPIYVNLSIIQFNTIPRACTEISFTTVDVITPPACTILLAPDNDAANVTVVTDIVWEYAPTATSYTLSIGTSEGGTDILDQRNVGNVLSYDPPEDLPQDLWIYVTVIPENENGIALPCREERFFTGAIEDPCEQEDPITGEMKSLGPEIEFPNLFIKCENSGPITVSAEGEADGFRWYRIENGNELLLSQNRNFQITEPGNYFLEAYNRIDRSGITLECPTVNSFNVIPSGVATIESVTIRKLTAGKQANINVTGFGDYEYAIDNEDGPYQDEASFYNIAEGPHLIFVRDKNGCGTVSQLIERGLKPEDFPKFFTPNADGINDYWQFIPPQENENIEDVIKGNISIYDRYGRLLRQIDPKSKGWDGLVKGRPVPSSDYWFRAESFSQQLIQGHFTLKR